MRILQSYRYRLGTKIPFDQLPAIIDRFLDQHGLTHRMFHYRFSSPDLSDSFRGIQDGTRCLDCGVPQYACDRCRNEAQRYLRSGTGCQRAVKEHPFLGPLRIVQERYHPDHILHNFSQESNEAKADIYSILSKIYRRYGFQETCLIYRDIDFFSRRVSTAAPDMEFAVNGYPDCGITLYRGGFPSGCDVILNVASDDPLDVPDAACYAEDMKQLLNCKKYLSATTLIMDDREKALYEDLNLRAAPLVKAAADFFDKHMPEEKGNMDPAAPVSVAAYLKKFGKKYGYAYKGYENYLYFMEKRLPGGHFVCLEFVSNPLSLDADPFVNLVGLGFRHQIWVDGFSPQNPRDAAEYFTSLFETLAAAEETVFPAIADLYPPTPEWFLPTH